MSAVTPPSAAELLARMADLNARIAAMVGEVGRLRLDLMKALPAGAGVAKRGDGLYYGPDGRGPFCPACYDTAGRLAHLVRMSEYFKALGSWQCNACDTCHARGPRGRK